MADTGKTIALIKALSNGGGGSGGGVLVVTETDGTLDKTWQEIHDAPLAVIYDKGNNGSSTDIVSQTTKEFGGTGHVVTTLNNESYTASSADGYPVLDE